MRSNGICAIIEKIEVEQLATPETTYNFEVEDFHTYYVSESNVLVHNTYYVGTGVCVHNRSCDDLDIYDNLEDSPYYPKDFISDGDPDVVPMKNKELEVKLQKRYPGAWVKVYDYGTINGSFAEVHYHARQVGYKQFDKFFLVKRKF